MASVANAFDLLVGTGEQVASAKKKKNKPKPKPEQNGSATHGPGDEAAGVAPQAAPAAAPKAAANAASSAVVVDAREACAIFERAAREAKSQADRTKLWKDWTRQAVDKSAKGMRYKEENGHFVEFKQVVLRSKALEISIEGAVGSGLPGDKEGSLVQLLAAFLPSTDHTLVAAIASSLAQLSAMLAGESPDTLGAAQRAVHSVVAALKEQAAAAEDAAGGATDSDHAAGAAGWHARLSQIEREVAKQQAVLAKLMQAGGGAVNREQLSCSRAIVRLHEEKFDLLQAQSGGTPAKAPGSSTEAALRSLAHLKDVINAHLQEAAAVESSTAKGAGASHDLQRAQALASLRREEAVLDQQAVQVAAQVRALEAQLQSLRAQADEIHERQEQIKRQRAAHDSFSSAKPGKAGTVVSSARYREELAVAQALSALVDPHAKARGSPEQEAGLQAAQASTPSDLVAVASHHLGLAQRALSEVPQKLAWARQRVSQAEKLAALSASMATPPADNGNAAGAAAGAGAGGHRGGKGGAGGGSVGAAPAAASGISSAAEAHLKQREEAEKLLADTMRAAEDTVSTSMQVVYAVRQRHEALTRTAPSHAAALAAAVHNIELLAAQVTAQFEAICSPPPAAPPAHAPPPAAAHAQAPHAYTQQQYQQQPHKVPPVKAQAAAAHVPAPAPAAAAPKPVVSTPPAAPAALAAAAPVPAPPAVPTRQWAKVEAAPPPSSDASDLPTPAEALKAAEEGFKQVPGGKKNRKKA